jgi:hypothetical protein
MQRLYLIERIYPDGVSTVSVLCRYGDMVSVLCRYGWCQYCVGMVSVSCRYGVSTSSVWRQYIISMLSVSYQDSVRRVSGRCQENVSANKNGVTIVAVQYSVA